MSAENVLVVDDEMVIGKAFKMELGSEGYNIDSVLSGEEALKSVRQKKYDVVFIDKVMPGMDGIETCRKIKKISPNSICIFMTGHFDEESLMKEKQFIGAGGRTYYLYKPFVKGELQKVIQEALKERK